MFNVNSIKPLYNQKITILNKIKGSDTEDGKDIWVKNVLDSSLWRSISISSASGTVVSLGTKHKIYICDVSKYKPYSEFISYRGESDYYTISLNDYIIKGEVYEDVTSKNITSILAKHEPNVCKVLNVNFLPDRNLSIVKIVIEGV